MGHGLHSQIYKKVRIISRPIDRPEFMETEHWKCRLDHRNGRQLGRFSITWSFALMFLLPGLVFLDHKKHFNLVACYCHIVMYMLVRLHNSVQNFLRYF